MYTSDYRYRFAKILDHIRWSRLEEYAWKHRSQIPERKARSFLLSTKVLEYIYEVNFNFQPIISMYSGKNLPIMKASSSVTSEVIGRPRPNELRKWEDFIPQQTIIWDQLMQSEFHLERLLPCLLYVENMSKVCEVDSYMTIHLGGDLSLLFKVINKDSALRARLGLTGSKVRIQTNNQILQPGHISKQNVPSNYPPEYVFCQHNGISDEEQPDLDSFPESRVFFILDHKIPCDLRYDEFKDIIQPMDLNLVDCDGEKSDPKERLRWIFAAFITEAYSNMIEEKVEYGCVTTGEITIFLRVPENDAHNIYYHISAPKQDLEDFGQSTAWPEEPCTINKPYLTTLGQIFGFTVQAMKSKQRSQNWCKNIFQHSKKWGEYDNDLLKDASDLEEVDQSHTTKVTTSQVSGDLEDIAGGSSQQGPIIGQYCTHKCLHGLKNGGKLDKTCPNWREHGSHSHLISHSQFLDSIYNQLAKDLDTNIERICTRGSCGVPFKVRLASYGYTFFAKFTPSWYVHYIQHEASIYDRMESIQGTCVPVHLGNIDLKHPYLFGRGVKLVHAMFLSFGGSQINESILATDYPGISQKVEDAFHKIHELNILHHDSEPRNILFDGATGQVTVIDFERAEAIEMQPAALQKSKMKKSSKVLNGRIPKKRNIPEFNYEIEALRSTLTELFDSGTNNH